MDTLKTTLRLYWDAAKDTSAALTRGWLAGVFLILSGLLVFVASMLVGGAGLLGGIIVGLLQCFLVGTYLELLRQSVVLRKTLTPDDIASSLGAHFSITLSVGFALGIPALILQFVQPELAIAWILMTALVLNAGVEVIYHQPAFDFSEVFRRAMSFLSTNWPEWFVGQLPVLVPILALQLLMSGSLANPLTWVRASASTLQIFSPHYGFIDLATLAAGMLAAGPVGWGLTALILVVCHLTMIFRGVLFGKLSGGNRRAREWAQRAGLR